MLLFEKNQHKEKRWFVLSKSYLTEDFRDYC